MSRIYEVPFLPDERQMWPLSLDGRVLERYPSRFEALRAAVNRAAADGPDASIGVEGADGVWRPFGSDIKRPIRIPPMRRRDAAGSRSSAAR